MFRRVVSLETKAAVTEMSKTVTVFRTQPMAPVTVISVFLRRTFGTRNRCLSRRIALSGLLAPVIPMRRLTLKAPHGADRRQAPSASLLCARILRFAC